MTNTIFDFPSPYLAQKKKAHIPVVPLTEKTYKTWLGKQRADIKKALGQSSFKAKPTQNFILRKANGEIDCVLTGVNDPVEYLDFANTADYISKNIADDTLKKTGFSIQKSGLSKTALERAHIGWGWAAYRFTAYKKDKSPFPALVRDTGVDKKRILAFTQSHAMLRNLVNTPAYDLGPDELEKAARTLAGKFKADISVIKGAALKKGFPLIQAVGESSPRAPRLLDIRWGTKSHPKITIIGKGVCYDTGGLNLKPGQYMKNMKKDMAGGAHALALGWLIMALKLPVCLRILVPTVENAVSGTSFRPGDVLQSRKGLTVENTNTDAEGRLILADSLTYASEEKTDLLIDFATLTGSARAALGPDIPAIFSNRNDLARQLQEAGMENEDPVWAMPLWDKYKKHIKSPVADLVNSASLPGDLIYSALFLQNFLKGKPDWIHLDIYAWTDSGQPGRPKGAADTGLRAVFALLEKKYKKKKS